MDEDEDARAHHEAGHALVASLLGARVLSCSVDADDTDGATEVLWPPTSNARGRAADRCAAALAGPVAELIYRDETVNETLAETWANDWAEAWDAATPLGTTRAERLDLLHSSMRRVRKILAQPDHEETLATLVDHLLSESCLDETSLDAILHRWER